ncbi:MAG: hypothetical protein LBR12_06775, partial [Opitutaceae bacterium]|nr:hypothetical protein [Opitutaceae bacterium]
AVLAQQKKLVAQMVRDELARAGLANPTKEQLAAAEKIAMDQVRSEFAPDKMRAAFAGVFADLYTKEELQAQTGFMRSAGGKEALKAIGGQPSPDAAAAVEAFHQSVLGKSIRAKQRILNQKTAEILAPKTAAVQTKARKALQDYAATQK